MSRPDPDALARAHYLLDRARIDHRHTGPMAWPTWGELPAAEREAHVNMMRAALANPLVMPKESFASPTETIPLEALEAHEVALGIGTQPRVTYPGKPRIVPTYEVDDSGRVTTPADAPHPTLSEWSVVDAGGLRGLPPATVGSICRLRLRNHRSGTKFTVEAKLLDAEGYGPPSVTMPKVRVGDIAVRTCDPPPTHWVKGARVTVVSEYRGLSTLTRWVVTEVLPG